MKSSFSYRNPSLLGCLLTIHQVQWNPRFREPQHRIIRICLLPDVQFYAPFETLVSLSARWSFCPDAGLPVLTQKVKKVDLLDCERLLSRAAVVSYRCQITLKRGLVCCYPHRGFVATSFQTKSKEKKKKRKEERDDRSTDWLPLLPSYITAPRTRVLLH